MKQEDLLNNIQSAITYNTKIEQQFLNAANYIANVSRKGSCNYIIVSPDVAKMWEDFDLEMKRKERDKKLKRILNER